jgi:acid stress-induced BolA-like protein IbaG/YrbA
MTLKILSEPSRAESGEEIAGHLESAIAEALPDARIEVRAASPGHFEIRVTSNAFEGKGRVQQQQLVYAAIAHLMRGDAAPVHAIDRLVTQTA